MQDQGQLSFNSTTTVAGACPTCGRPYRQVETITSVLDDREGLSHRNAPETSRTAAKRIAPKTGTQRYTVLRAIAGMGALGATDEQLVTLTHLPPNTVRPRRVELVQGNYVMDSGVRRNTVAGHRAVVWVATPSGRAAL